MMLAALAIFLTGVTRAAVVTAETVAPAAPACSAPRALAPADDLPDLGSEEDQRLLNLPPFPPVPRPLPTASELRRAKCAYLWARVAPWSYSTALCEFFVAEHERAGIGPEAYFSLVYGFSNFGLTIGKRVGPCYGPMDVRREWARACGYKANDLRDPRVNIRCHVREMAHYHRQTGETGMALLARVFYPASPRYYHRWKPTDRRFRKLLSEWAEMPGA